MPTVQTEPTLRIASLEDLERIVATYNATVPSRLVTADLEPLTKRPNQESEGDEAAGEL